MNTKKLSLTLIVIIISSIITINARHRGGIFGGPIGTGLLGAGIGGIAGGGKGAGIGAAVGLGLGLLSEAGHSRYYDDDYYYDYDYRDLRREHRNLIKKYNNLLDYARKFEGAIEDIESEYSDLQRSFDKGKAQYKQLEKEHEALQEKHDEQSETYKKLLKEHEQTKNQLKELTEIETPIAQVAQT